MSAQHTPGPIRYDYAPGYCGELIAANGTVICTFSDEPSKADAARIVRCVNANDELVAVARKAARFLGVPTFSDDDDANALVGELLSAIARATGSAS